MAGAFTHFMISKQAVRSHKWPKDLARCLEVYKKAMYLGSVSPDLPYASVIEEAFHRRTWSDYMHYYATNGIVINGIQSLRETWASRTENTISRLAWLLGYASHIIADATIHPIVRAIVGNYDTNTLKHFLCEQTQDILLFRECEGIDIVESGFITNNLAISKDILDIWKLLLLKTYFKRDTLPVDRKKGSAIRPHRLIRDILGHPIRVSVLGVSLGPERWSKWYVTLLDIGSRGRIQMLSRCNGVIGEELDKLQERLYYTADKIPVDFRSKYYSSVMLPKNIGKGRFMDEGFSRAVDNVVIGWKHIYDVLVGGSDDLSYFKDWNLDTGIVNGTDKMTFWT